MAIGAGAAGAWAATNATTHTVTLPSHAAGNLLVVIAACKAATPASVNMAVTTPASGWTRAAQFADGTTASGNGTGSVTQAIFYKEATSSSETNPVVTWGGSQTGAPGIAVGLSFSKATSEDWVAPAVVQKATNAATSISVTMNSNPGITAGDWGIVTHTTADDAALTVPTWTATSATLAAAVEYPATAIASGTSNDMAGDAAYRSVTSGTASAAPVCTGTQATAETGVTGFVRLRVTGNRVVTPTTVSLVGAAFAPAVTSVAGALTVTDTFSRSVTDGFGDATSGQTWSVESQNAVSDFDVTGSAGTIIGAADRNTRAWLAAVSVRDTDVIVRFAIDKIPATDNTFGYVFARGSGTDIGSLDFYAVNIVVTAAGLVRSMLTQWIDGNEVAISSDSSTGLTVAANGYIWVRLQTDSASPTTVRSRIWLAGTAEPGTWFQEQTDSTAGLQAAGFVGFATYTGGAVSNGPIVYSWDDLGVGNFAPTSILATPTTAALALTTFAPVLALAVTPTTAALALTTFAPVLRLVVTPTTIALVLTTFAPTVTATAHQVVTPTTTALTLTTFAPVLKVTLTPAALALVLATFAPTATATNHQLVTPTTASLTAATFAPTVSTSANQQVTPTTAALTVATFAPVLRLTVTPSPATLTAAGLAPTVTASNHQAVTPTTVALTLTTFAPTVSLSDHKAATPTTIALSLAAFAPTVSATAHQSVTPTTVALTLTALAPTVTASAHVIATPTTAALVLALQPPSVTTGNNREAVPGVVALTLTTFAPTVSATAHLTVTPTTAALVLTAFAPVPSVSNHQVVTPTTAARSLTTFAPTVTTSAGQTAIPATAVLTLTGFAPAASLSNHQTVTPTTAGLILTGRPVVPGQGITVGVSTLATATFAATISLSDHRLVTPGFATLATTGFAPVLELGGSPVATPTTAALVLTGLAARVGFEPFGGLIYLTPVVGPGGGVSLAVGVGGSIVADPSPGGSVGQASGVGGEASRDDGVGGDIEVVEVG